MLHEKILFLFYCSVELDGVKELPSLVQWILVFTNAVHVVLTDFIFKADMQR